MAQKLRPQAETLSGSPQPNFVGYSTAPILANRAPTVSDTGYPLGQEWIDKIGDDFFILTDVSAGVATWVLGGTNTGPLNTLTGDAGGAISPAAGNIDLLGTASQIETLGAGSSITFSIPAVFIAPGSIEATTSILSGTTITAGTTVTSGTGIVAGTTLTSAGATTLATTGASVNTFGNTTGATSVDVLAGTGGIVIQTASTGDIIINSDDTMLLDSDGVMELNSSAGAISIGNDAVALTINIGTGAAVVETINVGGTGANVISIGATQTAGSIAVGNAAAGAVTVDSAAGISVDGATASNFTVTGAGQDLTLSSVGGSIKVNSTESAAGAIALSANGGVAETITVTAAQGTGVASVELVSTAGGITVTAGLATADAINLTAAAGGVDIDGALQVNIASSQDAADAVRIIASAGGIDIDAVGEAGQDIVVTNTGGSVSIVATESAGDAIVINASGAAGGIDLMAGTGLVTCNTSFTLPTAATQFRVEGGAATDFIGTTTLANGVSPTIANTNIAAADQIYISRSDLNGSTELGVFGYVITPATDFVITAYDPTDATVATGDDSIVQYFIVRQL